LVATELLPSGLSFRCLGELNNTFAFRSSAVEENLSENNVTNSLEEFDQILVGS
jgi:hypothetical protein